MSYPTYLVHFNKNHDPKTGQFTKANKYQYTDGQLTSEGKQRWMTQLYSDIKKAAKKNPNNAYNVQTPINTKEWIKSDRRSNIGRGIWKAATIGVGGVYIGKTRYNWNQQAVDALLKQYSGDSIYKVDTPEAKAVANQIMNQILKEA